MTTPRTIVLRIESEQGEVLRVIRGTFVEACDHVRSIYDPPQVRLSDECEYMIRVRYLQSYQVNDEGTPA